MLTLRRRWEAARQDDGFTLIELLVSMSLFTGLLAVLMVATTTMFKDVRREQGQSDNLDGARLVLQLMDKQVRYANAINAETLQPDGTRRVEWQQGNKGARQTCVQWRLLPTGEMQWRSWKPILNAGDTLGTTAWSTRATGISFQASDFANLGTTGGVRGTTVGLVDKLFYIDTPLSATKQQLTISFATSHGTPPVRTLSQVTLTALNTASRVAPAPPVCQENP